MVAASRCPGAPGLVATIARKERQLRFALLGVLVVAAASGAQAGAVSAKVAPALDGVFRPGFPVALRVTVANSGPALDGWLDVVAERVAYRQPLRLGAGATAVVEALAAVRSDAPRVRLAVRSGGGEVLCDEAASVALRRASDAAGGHALVACGDEGAARRLFGAGAAAVPPNELPTTAAAYAALEALAVAGDGGEVPAAARAALSDWVRGGGAIAFLLDEREPVRTDSLLAELGECAGRPTGREWLETLASREATRPCRGGFTRRLALGTVAVAGKDSAQEAPFAHLLAGGARADLWADRGLLEAFGGASWPGAVRWRLAGGAAALVAVGALLVWLAGARRGQRAGRWQRALLAVAAAAALALAAWGLMLPGGKGTMEVAAVTERVEGEPGERRTEVVCLGAVGRTRVRLDFGAAEAVVPFYYGSEEVGSTAGAVVARDAAGRWTLECGLTRATRRCFGVWWPWRQTAAAGPEPGQGLGEVVVRGGATAPEGLASWGGADRALAAWQVRRMPATASARVRRLGPAEPTSAGEGVIARRCVAAQVCTRLPE